MLELSPVIWHLRGAPSKILAAKTVILPLAKILKTLANSADSIKGTLNKIEIAAECWQLGVDTTNAH